MPVIRLSTFIEAPREIVFDLTRSIDVHLQSTPGTSERAVAGITSGLIKVGEAVTWEARHFGFTQRLTVQITKMNKPECFEDKMVSGAFRYMHHRHEFVENEGGTMMKDVFDFSAPLGTLGRLAESLFLAAYMRRLLLTRAAEIKRIAESSDWRSYL